MENLLSSLQNLSFSPSYDGVHNPMMRLVKEILSGHRSEEAAIERIENSQEKVQILRYHPGRCWRLIHFAAANGYVNLLRCILTQNIESTYSKVEYVNSLDRQTQSPLRLANQNGHSYAAQLLVAHGAIERFPQQHLNCRTCSKVFVVQSRVLEDSFSKGRAAPQVCKKCKMKRNSKKNVISKPKQSKKGKCARSRRCVVVSSTCSSNKSEQGGRKNDPGGVVEKKKLKIELPIKLI